MESNSLLCVSCSYVYGLRSFRTLKQLLFDVLAIGGGDFVFPCRVVNICDAVGICASCSVCRTENVYSDVKFGVVVYV